MLELFLNVYGSNEPTCLPFINGIVRLWIIEKCCNPAVLKFKCAQNHLKIWGLKICFSNKFLDTTDSWSRSRTLRTTVLSLQVFLRRKWPASIHAGYRLILLTLPLRY